MLEQYGDFVEAITSSIRFPWKAFSTLLSILTSHIISFCNYGIALKVCIRKTFLYDSKYGQQQLRIPGAILERQNVWGSNALLKSALFEKKLFPNLKSVKSNFQWGGIRSTPIVLDHPRALLSKKVGLLLSLFSRKISFLNKWSRNFSYFLFEIFYHIHLFYKGWDIRCICCKCEHWSWK